MTLDMLKEELSKFGGICVIPSGYEQCILGDMAYYCEDAVVLLAILNQWWQTCDPIKADLLEW